MRTSVKMWQHVMRVLVMMACFGAVQPSSEPVIIQPDAHRGDCHFQQFRGYTIFGLNHQTYTPSTVAQCQIHCLQQLNPPCLSFDYVAMTSSCFVSTKNRASAPEFYGQHPLSDYYELVCVENGASTTPGPTLDLLQIGCVGSRLGREYRGQVSHTATGRECQRWDSQSPHRHSKKSYNMPGGSFSANENYCRNPDSEPGGVWCYTTDPASRWEYCDVPVCRQPEKCQETALCISDPCQGAECEAFPNATCVAVACVTCHTQHFVDNTRVSCIPMPVGDCTATVMGKDYAGNISHTARGLVCQAWDSQTPQKHDMAARNFPEGSLSAAGNKCRNPTDTSAGPWCYTMNRHVRWEHCHVPHCDGTATGRCEPAASCPFDPCEGKQCYPFPSARCVPDECEYCEEKWLLGSKQVNCTQPPIPFTVDCRLSSYGKEYIGTTRRTATGKLCQGWSSQYPHKHSQGANLFHEKPLSSAENYCRNPDNERGGPWCYTTDRAKRWEYCDIPECPDLGCPDGWMAHGSSCYLFTIDREGLRDPAKAYCESFGAHLVSIQNEAEFRFVTYNIRGVIETAESGGAMAETELWWTSGKRLTSSEFGWDDSLHSGPLTWTQWSSGEPDNHGGQELYINLKYTSGQGWGFSDISGAARLKSVCELETVNATLPTAAVPSTVTPSTVAEAQYQCPHDWHAFGGHCYLLSSKSFRNWLDASAACWREDAFLVSIETREEMDFLSSVLSDGTYFGQWWIGAFRSPRDDTWYWVGNRGVSSEDDLGALTEHPMQFTSWFEGEPNNWRDEEDSATIYYNGDKWGWNDAIPRDFRPFICETTAGGNSLPPCESKPCFNGGTCVSGEAYHDVIDDTWGSGDVIDDPGHFFQCSCAAGFAGTLCEINEDAPWKMYAGHSYLFMHEFATRHADAQQHCELHGAYLVSINSQAEQQFLQRHLAAIAVTSPHLTNWWTGAKHGAKRGDWLWEDGSVMGYTNWASGEPNSWQNEKSAELKRIGDSDRWKWNDVNANDKGCYFICELPIVFSDY